MKKFTLLFMCVLMGMSMYASKKQVFTDNGISYTTAGNKAKVTAVEVSEGTYTGNVVIPNVFTHEGSYYKVTTIVNKAFTDCTDLTSVTLPNTLTSIGSKVFKGCSNLKDIYVYCAKAPQLDSVAFICTGAQEKINIHVNAANAETFKAAAVWNTQNIVEDLPTVAVENINAYDLYYTVVGGIANFQAFTEPYTATQSGLTYESSDTTIVTTDEYGHYYGKGTGEATVKITSIYTPEVSKTVTVNIVADYNCYPYRQDAAQDAVNAAKSVYFESGEGESEITGISTVSVAKNNGIIYDLQGRQVSSPVAGGLYIQNSKKFIMK